MYTEQQVRDIAKRRNQILVPVFALASFAMLGYLLGLGTIRPEIEATVANRLGILVSLKCNRRLGAR